MRRSLQAASQVGAVVVAGGGGGGGVGGGGGAGGGGGITSVSAGQELVQGDDQVALVMKVLPTLTGLIVSGPLMRSAP